MITSQDPGTREARKSAESQLECSGGETMAPIHPDRHTTAHPAVETPVEGRQGFLGRPVLAVLIGGLCLAGLAWIGVHYIAP